MPTEIDEMESSRMKDMEGRDRITKGAMLGGIEGRLPNKPTKESITDSIEATTGEMVTIATLKEAIANYLLLDDIYEYEDTTTGFCLILGRLEVPLIRRKQLLDEDRKALLEL